MKRLCGLRPIVHSHGMESQHGDKPKFVVVVSH